MQLFRKGSNKILHLPEAGGMMMYALHSLLAPFYFIFRLSGCTYAAKLESIFSQVSVLKAVSVWSLLETNSQGVSQQLSRRRIMAPALELTCRFSHLAAYGHTLCFCPF